jgi:prepilin-type N-terminal cleavage/methylation domain-containing protein
MGRRGFTLVELLIVIAIIGLLFALLVRSMAGLDFIKKNTGCEKNLKDIHIALQAYTGASKGRYPYPIDTYYGRSFSGPYVAKDRWAGLPQLRLLKQYGLNKEMMHCPFDPQYGDWDAWPVSTWTTPYYTASNSTVVVYFGYSFFTYRSYPYWTSRFSNGLSPVISDSGLDTTPLVADSLFTRASGQIKWGWYHNGGLPDGLFNAGGNTLFKSGAVVSVDKESFDWDNPSFVIGSAVDLWWCALEP